MTLNSGEMRALSAALSVQTAWPQEVAPEPSSLLSLWFHELLAAYSLFLFTPDTDTIPSGALACQLGAPPGPAHAKGKPRHGGRQSDIGSSSGRTRAHPEDQPSAKTSSMAHIVIVLWAVRNHRRLAPENTWHLLPSPPSNFRARL
jgi:hypothetical protein